MNYFNIIFSDPSEIKDLLTLLLTSDDPRPEVTIIDEGLTFLFAGYDTTSKLLVNVVFTIFR